MAAGATYTPIATSTLGSSASSITFSSISGSYTDLIVVLIGTNGSANNDILLEVGNGSIDTGSNYSSTYLYGNGTSAAAGRYTSSTFIEISQQGTSPGTTIFHIQNYANTTNYKTVLSRGNDSAGKVWASVGLWRSTSAINTIKIYPYSGNLNSGTTATIYGIVAA